MVPRLVDLIHNLDLVKLIPERIVMPTDKTKLALPFSLTLRNEKDAGCMVSLHKGARRVVEDAARG